jgi:hypothetical protein
MTEDDIKSVEILAKTKDGELLYTKSEDRMLIRCILLLCKFERIKKVFRQQPFWN